MKVSGTWIVWSDGFMVGHETVLITTFQKKTVIWEKPHHVVRHTNPPPSKDSVSQLSLYCWLTAAGAKQRNSINGQIIISLQGILLYYFWEVSSSYFLFFLNEIVKHLIIIIIIVCWQTCLEFGDSRSDTLHDASSLVTKDRWEAVFIHTLQKVVEVWVAHRCRHNLHQRKQPNKQHKKLTQTYHIRLFYPFSGSFVSLKFTPLTLMRTSLACGGATSISSITTGLLGSQATAALHLMTLKSVTKM